MKKLKFAEISVGDWIYWVDYSRNNITYFVSNVKEIDIYILEEWWKINNTFKKFNTITNHRNNENFDGDDFKPYNTIRKMTKKEIEEFKVKLVVVSL